MKIPQSSRKQALIVVDVQPSFLNKRNKGVVGNILKLIKNVPYSVYVAATFHAEKGSLWDIQQEWTCPEGEGTKTVTILTEELNRLHPIKVYKETKSVFKGNKEVTAMLKRKGVQEVHVVGLDTNDCVLATAYEAFDLGFVTYVIEECCGAPTEALHKKSLDLLREQNMTNRSCIEKIDFLKIE